MKAKFDTIIMYVRNVQLLKQFYMINFDLTVIEEDEIWVLLNTGNVNIGLHRIGEKYLKTIDPDYQFENNIKIVFEIEDDIRTVREKFIINKIQMRELKTFKDYDFWLCDGIDPEGNVFQLKAQKKYCR